MKLLFLGTSAGKPSNHRNVTSIAVILQDAEYILVDCGEATQHQIMKSELKLSKLKDIYITHLHGDHIFGLPGLLCTLNEIRTESLTISGPRGLKNFLNFPLKNINNFKVNIQEFSYQYEHATVKRHYSGNYEYVVELALIEHGVTCFAYKITEIRISPQIDMDLLFPHLDYHRFELEKLGFQPAEKIINTLKMGHTITLDSGFCFDMKNYLKRENNKSIVIALDNYESKKMVYYFGSCDVLVHECTYALTNTMSEEEKKEIQKLAFNHKHSTNVMALDIAKKMKARMLILTHFSNRYDFDDESQIIKGCGNAESISIECARDFTEFCICNK